jgi:DNA repair protein RadC
METKHTSLQLTTAQYLNSPRDTEPLQPRERLLSNGAAVLSDEELLAIMLGTGIQGTPVHALAASVLPILEQDSEQVHVDQLLKVPGIGPSKASVLAAAMEFTRRRIRPNGIRVRTPVDVVPLLHYLLDRPQEEVTTFSLNGAHEILRKRTVCVGLLTSCPIHPREVFVGPICDRANAVILAHNHPSGDPTPSEDDRKVTRQMKSAASIIGIKLLDHIVVARRGYYSFHEQGEL